MLYTSNNTILYVNYIFIKLENYIGVLYMNKKTIKYNKMLIVGISGKN